MRKIVGSNIKKGLNHSHLLLSSKVKALTFIQYESENYYILIKNWY